MKPFRQPRDGRRAAAALSPALCALASLLAMLPPGTGASRAAAGELDDCPSPDPTGTAACFALLSDSELAALLAGSGGPFEPPRIGREVVDGPAAARAILEAGDDEPCEALARELLAATLAIRRSALEGNGRLGENLVGCFGIGHFCVGLRCGGAFVPLESTPAPDDGVVLTVFSTLDEVVSGSSELLRIADCRDAFGECAETTGELWRALAAMNASRADGGCGTAPAFLRGDANGDAGVDIADPIWTVEYLFKGGPPPRCLDAADTDDSGGIDLADVLASIHFLLMGSAPPPEPYLAGCGADPTGGDDLGCEAYESCRSSPSS